MLLIHKFHTFMCIRNVYIHTYIELPILAIYHYVSKSKHAYDKYVHTYTEQQLLA
jgi:hypothetical protein